ncbi:MAG: glutathione S-transferase family protein [Alphaproteobacteria bacterium]
MPSPVIFGFPQSTYVRTVRLTCVKKGVAYDLVPMGFSSDGLADKHPFRRIPAFEHGDLALFETSAICRYIDAAFDGPALVPDTPAELALMEQWVSVANAYVDPPVIRDIVMERVVKPMLNQEVDEAKCAAAAPRAREALDVLDRHLGVERFLVGDAPTLADFFLLPMVFYFRQMPEGDAMLPGFRNLDRWYADMASRDSFAATQPPPPGER